MKKSAVFIFSLIFTVSVFANSRSYSATGIGDTESAALADAMGTIAQTLQANVQSTTLANQNIKEKNSRTKSKKQLNRSISISTDVPLLGLTTSKSVKNADGLFVVKATLDSENVIPLYEKELSVTAQKLEATFNSLQKPEVREQAQTLYDYFEKLSSVGYVLGAKSPSLTMDRTSFDQKILEYADKYSSLPDVTAALASHITKKHVFVTPVTYEAVPGVSDFAYTLQQYTLSALGSQTVAQKYQAAYILSGTCFRGEKTFDGKYTLNVSFTLSSAFGSTVYVSPVYTLLPSALEGKSYIPTGLDFQYELAETSHHDFDIELSINNEIDNVVLKKGDNAYIRVKAAQECFIYVVGYVFNNETKNEPFAYLFPLNIEADGKQMFAKKISSSETNRWIDLNPVVDGEVYPIEIIPPFGVEILQVFASTEKDIDSFLKSLPSYKTTDDYYVLGSPSSALSASRGMNIKKASENAANRVKTSEGRITYTTRN